MRVFRGRYRAEVEGDFVVFLIGMRINKPWQLRQWLWVFRAMPKMIEELEADPDSGFIAAERGLMYGGPALIQWWRSFEHLDRYARAADALHLPAWREFNRRIRDNGNVGIWHETYKVRAGEYEAVYGNMPAVGLAAATAHAPVGSTSTAAKRIGARDEDTAPVSY
jgi:hypothetical protein